MDDCKKESTNKHQRLNRPSAKPAIKHFQLELTKAFKTYMQQQGIDPKTTNLFKQEHCFGLSVCFGTFFLEKKHKWWTSLLQAIVSSRTRFTKAGYLDEIAHDWHLPQQDKPQTHRQLIERAINYVIFSHAASILLPEALKLSIEPSTYQQNTYLSTPEMLEKQRFYDKDFFLHEHISKTGELIHIQSSETISAHFSKDLLCKTIEICDFENSISIFRTNTHCCTLVYNKRHKQYGFYDPAAKKASAYWFKKKEELVDKIFELNKATAISLCLTHASMEPNRQFFESFKALLDDPATFEKLYSSQVFPMLINKNSTLAKQVLPRLIQKNRNFFPDAVKAIIKQLTPLIGIYPTKIHDTIQNLLMHSAITSQMYHQLLSQLDDKLFDGKSLLFHLATHAPIELCYMFAFQEPPRTSTPYLFFSAPQRVELYPLLSKRLEDDKTLQAHLTPFSYFVLCIHYWKPATIFLGVFLLLLKAMPFITPALENESYRPVPR